MSQNASVIRAGPLKKEAALFWRKKNVILTSRKELQVDKEIIILDPDNPAHKCSETTTKGKENTFSVTGSMKGKGNLTTFLLQADTREDMEGWLYALETSLGKESQYTPKDQLGVQTITPSSTTSISGATPSATPKQKTPSEKGIDLNREVHEDEVYRPPSAVTLEPAVETPKQAPMTPPPTPQNNDELPADIVPYQPPDQDDEDDDDEDSPRNIKEDDDDDDEQNTPQQLEADINTRIKNLPHAIKLLEDFPDHAELTVKCIEYLDSERKNYGSDEYIGIILGSDGLQPLMYAADIHNHEVIINYVLFITGNLLDRETEKYRTMIRLFSGFRIFTKMLKNTPVTNYARIKRILLNLTALSQRPSDFSSDFLQNGDYKSTQQYMSTFLDHMVDRKMMDNQNDEDAKAAIDVLLTSILTTLYLCMHDSMFLKILHPY